MILAFDTATPLVSVALHDGERVVVEHSSEQPMKHGEQLAPLIARAMEEAGVVRQDLTAVAVGVGPGSYTGVRVAIATAKGMARALDVPLHGASTLAAVAASRLLPGERGVAVLDARRGNVYAALVQRAPAHVERAPRVRMLDGPHKIAAVDLPTRFPAERVLEEAPPDAAALAMTAVGGAGERPEPPEAVYL